MSNGTTFYDDCVNAFRNGSYPPFEAVKLTVNIGGRLSVVEDELKVMLANGKCATESITPEQSAVLLSLFTDHQGLNHQEPII